MKTTDSVMREFDEKFEYKSGDREDGFNVLFDRSDDLPASSDNIKDFISHSLAEAVRAAYSNGWEDHMKDPNHPQEPRLLQSDLLTGDNPEEAK